MYGLINHVVEADKLEETVMDMARDLALIERKNPGYIQTNKILINRNHPELTNKSTLNPQELEERPLIIEYMLKQIKSQEEFFTTVANEGIETALDRMHEGFTSRT